MIEGLTRRATLKAGLGAAGLLAAPSIARAQQLRPVTLMTPFGFIGDFIEMMNAHSGGHFRKHGVEAKIHGAQGTAQALQQLVAGQVDIIRAASIDHYRVVAVQKVPLVSVSTIYQASTFWMVSTPEKPIRAAEELKGKTVGIVSVKGTTETFLDIIMKKGNLRPEDVKREVVGNNPAALQYIRQGRIDCFICSSQVVQVLSRQGEKIEYWSTDKYAPMPGQCYITTRGLIEKDADRVVRTLRGLNDSVQELLGGAIKPAFERAAKDFEIQGIKDIDGQVAVNQDAQKLWLAQGRGNLLRNVPALWEAGAKVLAEVDYAKVADAKVLYTNELIDRATKG